jgi:hypothetical protein
MVFPSVDAIRRHFRYTTSDQVAMPKVKANHSRQLTGFDVTGDQITVFLFDLRLQQQINNHLINKLILITTQIFN